MRLDPRFKEVTQGVTAFFVSPLPGFLFFFFFLFLIFDIDFLPKLDIHMVLIWWPATLGLPAFSFISSWKKKRIFVPSPLGKHYGIH